MNGGNRGTGDKINAQSTRVGGVLERVPSIIPPPMLTYGDTDAETTRDLHRAALHV